MHETVEKDHGRIEIRRYAVGDALDWLTQKPEWPGLSAVGRVESIRQRGDKTTTDCRYCLCSFTNLTHFAETVRGHWGIENCLHHVLDTSLGEDASRIRQNPGVFAQLRHFSLNLLRYNGQTNIRAALYDNAISLDRVLAYKGIKH